MKTVYKILERPCLTEKGNLLQETENKVVLKVNTRANKIEIKNAVEKLFDVKVAKVATTNMVGKKKRVGVKSIGRTSNWKKAYVTLAEGKINFLDEL
ncbi:50S ribosomal protein L23 [Desulfobulbus oligotrophicus]|uniref:Large ribosomal subunit protein uL23 n=1 Tax=Desulfobulbus oligotrophicus TaxID=1909699 RepID=A0A7T5VDB7_9BACT|nr:50S ribosomal protein L23 [Desulfobulbus oligotrophicus]MDY0390364.1 50S ribosomal protein L23 [Desulfobulbus oligotrophicus]QQG65726.1 50S ribosomal protein L23 [Desulfobulbus oligotrophicus]